MAKRAITIDLDDETFRWLGALGEPGDVLLRLAHSAATGAQFPTRPPREQTDESLRGERHKADVGIADAHARGDDEADAVVQVARGRADQVVQLARDEAAAAGAPSAADEARSANARTVLESERSNADSALASERAQRRLDRAVVLRGKRKTTDENLLGERTFADTALVDQREANEQMVGVAIRAESVAEQAETARARAEQNERELREMAEFRELFIGILGHDLRNPVGSISMAAALLLSSGNLQPKDADIAARIIRSSQRISRMINQLLDFTRARLGGGFPIERTTVDLSVLCRNIIEELDGRIEVTVEGDLIGQWDGDRVAEALSNLVGNALDYATPGTAVRVNAYVDGPDAVVEIANEGPAIPADLLPHIFEPFRREQRKVSPAGNLGLGLYIADQIVRSHGGSLEAGSADGVTTFTLRLPRRAG